MHTDAVSHLALACQYARTHAPAPYDAWAVQQFSHKSSWHINLAQQSKLMWQVKGRSSTNLWRAEGGEDTELLVHMALICLDCLGLLIVPKVHAAIQ